MKANAKVRVVFSIILSLAFILSANPLSYAHEHHKKHNNLNITTNHNQICTTNKSCTTTQICRATEQNNMIAYKPMEIKLTDEYIKCLNAYKANPNDLVNINKLKLMNQKLVDMNPYKAEVALNDEIEYDINNLPYEVRVELSLMTADLINSIRKQMGTEPVMVTQSSVEFANEVAKEYRKDNWDWAASQKLPHDGMAVKRAATPYRLLCPEDNEAILGSQWYEDFSALNIAYDKMSMKKMKESIYNSVIGFMFNGHEWDHAMSMAGIETDDEANNKCDYIGVAYDSYIGRVATQVQDKFTGKLAWHGKDSKFGVHVITVHDYLIPYCTVGGCPAKKFLVEPITKKNICNTTVHVIE